MVDSLTITDPHEISLVLGHRERLKGKELRRQEELRILEDDQLFLIWARKFTNMECPPIVRASTYNRPIPRENELMDFETGRGWFGNDPRRPVAMMASVRIIGFSTRAGENWPELVMLRYLRRFKFTLVIESPLEWDSYLRNVVCRKERPWIVGKRTRVRLVDFQPIRKQGKAWIAGKFYDDLPKDKMSTIHVMMKTVNQLDKLPVDEIG